MKTQIKYKCIFVFFLVLFVQHDSFSQKADFKRQKYDVSLAPEQYINKFTRLRIGGVLSINNFDIVGSVSSLLHYGIEADNREWGYDIQNCVFNDNLDNRKYSWTLSGRKYPIDVQYISVSKTKNFAEFELDSITSKINISNSEIKKLRGTSLNGSLDIQQTTIEDEIEIQSSNLNLSFFQLNNKQGKSNVRITYSKLHGFRFSESLVKNTVIIFEHDSLSSMSTFQNDSNNLRVFFIDCFINGSVNLKSEKNSIICYFENCEFGPSATINLDQKNHIVFDKCNKFATPLRINTFFSNENSTIELAHSDIQRLDFDYLGNLLLVNTTSTDIYTDTTDILVTQENSISNYEKLLAKYKIEGRVASYKNLYREYRSYESAIGNWEENFLYFLDKYYWNFGYDKIRVFYWTMTFIGIFWIFNLFSWQKFHSLYPVYHNNWSEYFQRKKPIRYKLYRALRIFLFTTVLFFSFKLNFDKLKQHSNRYIAWILFQYVIGVLSLFFIFNAVVKL